MQPVHLNQIIQALQTIGIQANDGLLVHSAVQFLGKPEGGIGIYLEAIQAVIGPQGTLAVPAFNFTFAKSGQYDPQETPSGGMGAFSEYVRQHPQARRTTHPMQSVAVIGRYADELARLDTPSAFDPGSAFERMLELDFKLLLLGAEVHAISMLHYSEQRANVPYRYWKDFSGQICRRGAGAAPAWETHTYRMFVRHLQIDPYLRLDPIQRMLEERRQWRSTSLNYGTITAFRMADFVAATDELLADDPWALVANRPLLEDEQQTTDD